MKSLPDNPSEAFKRLNPHLYPSGVPVSIIPASNETPKMHMPPAKPPKRIRQSSQPLPQPDTRFKVSPLVISIVGQVRGGKNNMMITKTGHHYPNKQWAIWRDDAVKQVKRCLPPNFTPIAVECLVVLDYVTFDKRRRDFPAICDALWHVMEKAGVVTDDTLLWPVASTRNYDPTNAHVILTIRTK